MKQVVLVIGMSGMSEARPEKKVKTMPEYQRDGDADGIASPHQGRDGGRGAFAGGRGRGRGGSGGGSGRGRGGGGGGTRPFISASGIHAGDKGIFVTCDKGMERRALGELGDLLGQVCSFPWDVRLCGKG